MKYADLTLATPAENLALDEALLDECESGAGDEVLRFWEARERFVVLGYGNEVVKEVNIEACHDGAVPVFRRTSGGGTVLQAPGCLSYALVLRIEAGGPLDSIPGTNAFVLQRNAAALSRLLGQVVTVEGHTDLVIAGRKFSGNSQRRKRHALLFHGTLLLKMDLAMVGRFLRMPSQEPDYRRTRPHADFLTNAGLAAETCRRTLREAWGAQDQIGQIPFARVHALVSEKYGDPRWNLRIDA